MSDAVSIVIPCYNKRNYVAAAIDSALEQTHPCEVIVVDDGSTDGSLDVIRAYEGRIIWTSGPNRGGCAARNKGFEMSRGDWIQFLDADDILPAQKVQSQLAVLDKAPEASIATCPWSYLHDDGRSVPPSVRSYWKSYDSGLNLVVDMWYQGGFFPPHCWLVPRSLVMSVGPWDEELSADQDGEFFGRILASCNRLEFCAETNVFYREPPDGAVSRNRSHQAARSRLAAFETIARLILTKRSDIYARKACLSRIRRTAYALREYEDIVQAAQSWERELAVSDFSPSLPPLARFLVGLLGIRRGLSVRDSLKH